MRKDHSELNQEFLARRIWRRFLRVFIIAGLLIGAYSIIIALFALNSVSK